MNQSNTRLTPTLSPSKLLSLVPKLHTLSHYNSSFLNDSLPSDLSSTRFHEAHTFRAPEISASTANSSSPQTNINNTPSLPSPPTLPLQPPATSNICTIYSTQGSNTFTFHCTSSRCRNKTFTRWYDFNRHFNGAHAAKTTIYWCPVAECIRSEEVGTRGFPRKDKMMDHVGKVHCV
jgi:hypothetical protein